MFISTEIDSFKKYGSNREIIKMLKDAGFEAYDFSTFLWTKEAFIYDDDYLEQAKALREYADEIGIACNQMHAPFPTRHPFNNPGYAKYLYESIALRSGKPFPVTCDAEAEYDGLLKVLITRALEIAQVLGAKICVVHPHNAFSAEQNLQIYREFEPIARRTGVKIALENMWCWAAGSPHATAAACSNHEDFAKHLSLLPEDVFVACLDIGHAEMEGLETSAVQMIKTLGNRLQCLHIHDNDKLHDSHELACSGKIDFDAICKALKEAGYEGDLTMEADRYAIRYDPSFFPKAARFMYDIGDYLRSKILK